MKVKSDIAPINANFMTIFSLILVKIVVKDIDCFDNLRNQKLES